MTILFVVSGTLNQYSNIEYIYVYIWQWYNIYDRIIIRIYCVCVINLGNIFFRIYNDSLIIYLSIKTYIRVRYCVINKYKIKK